MIVNIYSMLAADTDIAAAVADRIYMTVARQHAETPFIVWQPISSVPYNTLALGPTDDQQRIQIDVYAGDPTQARALADAVTRCVAQHGNVLSGAIPSFEDATRLHRYSLDVSLFHRRAS